MAVEYRGDEFLYLVEIDDAGKKDHRFFNQTDGSSSIEADSIELETKDKSGADYGNVTETVSIEGILTKDDPTIPYIKKALRTKKMVKIYQLNTRDLSTEMGMYKVDNFEQESSYGEYVTYSIEATLNGFIKEGTLEESPEGAPEESSDGAPEEEVEDDVEG